jgi:uncharacterized coiled-coil protein SlyX
MRKIRLAFILVAALAACEGNSTLSNQSDAHSNGGRASGSAESLQSKVVMPAPPAAQPVMNGVATGEAAAGPATVEAADRGSDGIQGVSYASVAANTMIIRTGQAYIEVDKVDPAILKVRQLVAQAGGYITNSSISGGKDQIRQASIEIKIPNTKYDEAVGSLSSIGKVETVNSNAQDVGEEFVDVTARVANARRLEERLIDLLARRTGKLDEVLRVERELARVREEIERYEGRLRYLTTRVAMSTLTITVHEPAPIIEPGRSPITEAFRRAWQTFVAMLAALIASLGVLVPVGLIGLGGWIGYRKWGRPVRVGAET